MLDHGHGAQQAGERLGQRVVDVDPEGGLDARPHLEALRVAVRREQLDVEVPVVGAIEGDGRRLLHAHHVRQREVPESVVAADHVGQGGDEVQCGPVVEVAEPADAVGLRPHVHLQRPAGRERHRRHEVLVLVHDPLAAEVVVDEPAPEALVVGARCRAWLASLVSVTGGTWSRA